MNQNLKEKKRSILHKKAYESYLTIDTSGFNTNKEVPKHIQYRI